MGSVTKYRLPKREKDERPKIIKAYEDRGWVVLDLGSQGRVTRQTPGVPDFLVFTGPTMFWHESKAKTGRQSEAQRDFQFRCERAGIVYVLGGEREAFDHARSH
jgi:hypothetical protein